MHRRLGLASFLVTGALLVLSTSNADAAPSESDPIDTIVLSNGGRVRGTILVDDPKSGVTVRLLDGTTRVLKRAEVKSVQWAETPPPPAEPEPTAPPPPPPPPPPPATPAPKPNAAKANASKLVLGGGPVGGYLPVDDGIGAVGAQGILEVRSPVVISRFQLATVWATQKKSDTWLAFIDGMLDLRVAPVYALGAGGGLAYRWSSGKAYKDGGHDYHSKDTNAPVAFLIVNPMLLTLDPIEIELAFFIGHDIVQTSSAPTEWLPGGWLGVSGVLPLSK